MFSFRFEEIFIDKLQANNQDELATIIMDEVHSLVLAGQEDMHGAERKTNSEGGKVISLMKEQVQLFDSRLKERERAKEKLDKLMIAPERNQLVDEIMKRQQKFTAADEALRSQTRRTYEVQKEFYVQLSRYHKDSQLKIIRSVVDTQTHLFNFVNYFLKTHEHCFSVYKEANKMLSNAAYNILHSFRETSATAVSQSSANWTMTTMAPSDAVAFRLANMQRYGVEGYEMALQRVLEDLLLMAQNSISPSSSSALGSLDMSDESTACLAARNPSILAELPGFFGQAIGSETCVWVNNLNGRLYRDICHSNFFYKWFCSKLTYLINKGARPGFIEKFEVVDAEFGSLPPLLSNVRWSPIYQNYDSAQGQARSKGKAGSGTGGPSDNGEDSSDDETTDIRDKDPAVRPEKDVKLLNGAKLEDFEYYAASTADMAFRSGIKFKITTKYSK